MPVSPAPKPALPVLLVFLVFLFGKKREENNVPNLQRDELSSQSVMPAHFLLATFLSSHLTALFLSLSTCLKLGGDKLGEPHSPPHEGERALELCCMKPI